MRDAELVATDDVHDLALLRIVLDKGAKVPCVKLADSAAVQDGQTVIVSSRPNERIFANFVGSASTAQRGILNAGGGAVTYGHDALAATLQIDRLAKAFSKRKLGRAIARAVQAAADFMSAIYTTAKGAATWRTYVAQGGTAMTRLAAVFILYGEVHMLADEYNVPMLKSFVD